MPHFSEEYHFKNDCRRLKRTEMEQFREALRAFIQTLSQWESSGGPWPPPFPAALRIKDVDGHKSIWELTWAFDGRCTWRFGAQKEPGKTHIVWRRIGGHEIFNDP